MIKPSLQKAKTRLDEIINKGRVDFYKPIQIAEVLRRSRPEGDIDVRILSTYQNPSLRWRDEITMRLSGKRSTSSARYQHAVWNNTAMPSEMLSILDVENKRTGGAVERYIFLRYGERQETVANVLAAIEAATPENFQLKILLEFFVSESGIRRSIDKAYEIVAYAVFETLVVALSAVVSVRVPAENKELLKEFSDLARVLLGLGEGQLSWKQPAHIYRVGVTNAADRGLDMWANFGPAIQVKHLTLNPKLASGIIDQIESDHIVIVCRDVDAEAIQTIAMQIGWGRRVRGIVRESDLIEWYEKCLRGKFSDRLAVPLLRQLLNGFKQEFPQGRALQELLTERGYSAMTPSPLWTTQTDAMMTKGKVNRK